MSYEVWGEPDDPPECQSCEEAAKDYEALEKTVTDLAMLVKRLASQLPMNGHYTRLADQAMDYLSRNKLDGSPLRETPNVKVRGASGYAAKRPSRLTGWATCSLSRTKQERCSLQDCRNPCTPSRPCTEFALPPQCVGQCHEVAAMGLTNIRAT